MRENLYLETACKKSETCGVSWQRHSDPPFQPGICSRPWAGKPQLLFFEENIRDYEYEAIVDIGVEALEYDDIVLINAPFTKEVHNEETLEYFRTKFRAKGAKLVII